MSEKFKSTLLKKALAKTENSSKTAISNIPLSAIVANPYQPRLSIEEKELRELACSIEEQGLLQPILVTEGEKGKYIVIAGHRRVEACRLLNHSDILAHVVKNITKEDLISFSITENLQRENLSVIEEAIAFKQALLYFGSVKSLSEKLGMDRTTVNRKINLLKLNNKVLSHLNKNKSTKDVKALNLLNQVEDDLQYNYYLLLLENGREWLIDELKRGKEANTKAELITTKIHKKSIVFTVKNNGENIDPNIAKKIEKAIKKIMEEAV